MDWIPMPVHKLQLFHKGREVMLDGVHKENCNFMRMFDHAMNNCPIKNGTILNFRDRKRHLIENDMDMKAMFDRFRDEITISVNVEEVGGPLRMLSDDPVVLGVSETEGVCVNEKPTDKVAENPIEQPQSQPCSEQPVEEQPQPQPMTQTKSSQSRKKKTQKSCKGKGVETGSSGRYKLRKKKAKVSDDFIMSDEEIEQSSDEEFFQETGFEESSDEELELSENSEVEVDEMLSDCPEDTSEEEVELSGEEGQKKDPMKGIKGKLFKGPVSNEFEFKCGMLFKNAKHFRDVLEDYQTIGGYDIIRTRNDKNRVTLICGNEKCEWRLYASKLPDLRTFAVKTIGTSHVCLRDPEKAHVTPKWIAKVMKGDFRAQPDMPWTTVEETLRRKFGVEAKQACIYKAKRWAKLENEGSLDEAFSKLHGYAQVLKRLDPGTQVKFSFLDSPDNNEQPIFQRMFVAFAATVDGFLKGCRPFFGIDGTHLRGDFDGCLLTAVSLDGNKGTFPIAFCISEGENTDSWVWFLQCLNECIGDHATNGVPYTIMSDKQKGLIKAVELIFPTANSRFCTRHLYANLKKEVPGLDIKEIFWTCTRATNQFEFDSAMDWMHKTSEEAYVWLKDKPTNQWSRFAYDLTSKSEHQTNNMAESFNAELKKIRKMDPLKMVDEIRKQLMSRFYKRYTKGTEMQDNKVTKNCKQRLMILVKQAGHLRIIPGREDNYEVVEGPNQFAVDLKARTCSCNWWAISGLPCKHVVKAVMFNRADLEDYCDPYFSNERYLAAYNGIIHSLPTAELALAPMDVQILKPPCKRQPGRPRVKRIKGEDEDQTAETVGTLQCSICRHTGHNQRTCQGGPVKKKAKKKKKQTVGSFSSPTNTKKQKAAATKKKKVASKASTSIGQASKGKRKRQQTTSNVGDTSVGQDKN